MGRGEGVGGGGGPSWAAGPRGVGEKGEGLPGPTRAKIGAMGSTPCWMAAA